VKEWGGGAMRVFSCEARETEIMGNPTRTKSEGVEEWGKKRGGKEASPGAEEKT